MAIRTDLALEAKQIWEQSAGETTELEGVTAEETVVDGFRVTTVRVLDDRGAAALGKAVGTYVTIELDGFIKREDDAFERGVNATSEILCKLIEANSDAPVLIAGLGNAAITPDSIGPETAKGILATWHLPEKEPKIFGSFRKVSVIETGVLGTTGIESADMISAVVEKLRPACVIAVDALASRSAARLCRTIQITDTGIVPGSGIGNGRSELSQRSLGVPVIAVGVPTVVDAATLASDVLASSGIAPGDADFAGASGMIVTPKEIDTRAKEISRLAACAINLALHPQLGLGDLEMLMG